MNAYMNFSGALNKIKAGRRVARAGWNGKGMWLSLIAADAFQVALIDQSSVRLLPWIGMKTADNGFVPWLASQTDILADDWDVVAA
jgi:hypothetical protein